MSERNQGSSEYQLSFDDYLLELWNLSPDQPGESPINPLTHVITPWGRVFEINTEEQLAYAKNVMQAEETIITPIERWNWKRWELYNKVIGEMLAELKIKPWERRRRRYT